MQSDTSLTRRLDSLRDSHRLGMHVWEDEKRFHFPKVTWQHLNAVSPEDIPARLALGTMPLLSMSLLPSARSGKSMQPWGVEQNRISDPTYLVDLDQHQEHATRVARANVINLGTGSDVYAKHLKLEQKTGIASLDALYSPFASDGRRWRNALAEKGGLHTQMQLDALGRHMESPNAGMASVLPLNEIVVASHHRHIAAIGMPLYTNGNAPEWYPAMMTLTGALAGLQHLEKTRQTAALPVVHYHVGPAMPGTFSLLGTDKRQFIHAALKALAALDESKIRDALASSIISPHAFKDLHKNVMHYLGVDIARPLSEQRAAVMRLEKEEGYGSNRQK